MIDSHTRRIRDAWPLDPATKIIDSARQIAGSRAAANVVLPDHQYGDCQSVAQCYELQKTLANGFPAFPFAKGINLSADVRVRFGERLRTVRTKHRISQERLAELAGLHRTFVSLIERGQRNITLETVEKLADALGVGMAALMPRKS
jgi:DNA-binding XRE family transcriptional regulator